MASSSREPGRQPGRARPGHHAGHLPGGQLDPHRPDRVRPEQHPVRRHVPAAGGDGHHDVAARRHGWRAASAPSGCCSSGWPRTSPRWSLLVADHRLRDRPGRGLPVAAAGHGLPGRRLRAHSAVLNTFVAAFQPEHADRAVLVLNALLGLGTALAPVFVAVFVGLGFWWGLPVLSTSCSSCSLLASVSLPLHAGRGRRCAR